MSMTHVNTCQGHKAELFSGKILRKIFWKIFRTGKFSMENFPPHITNYSKFICAFGHHSASGRHTTWRWRSNVKRRDAYRPDAYTRLRINWRRTSGLYTSRSWYSEDQSAIWRRWNTDADRCDADIRKKRRRASVGVRHGATTWRRASLRSQLPAFTFRKLTRFS
jgi:hypothetical protein